MDTLSLIGRNQLLFSKDIQNHELLLSSLVGTSRFLVIGGAGSIGQAVTKEIFKRNPIKLHVVDTSNSIFYQN
jgi:UDP-N-acetylglucosamine 4,6-dehydratase